jgi:hypothetical protein
MSATRIVSLATVLDLCLLRIWLPWRVTFSHLNINIEFSEIFKTQKIGLLLWIMKTLSFGRSTKLSEGGGDIAANFRLFSYLTTPEERKRIKNVLNDKIRQQNKLRHINTGEISFYVCMCIYIYIYIYIYMCVCVCVCCLVVRVPGYRYGGPGSILGTNRSSEK